MISVILAAGKGTRMKSELPKVIHKVNGVPMLQKVSDVLEKTGVHKKIFILGHMKEKVLSVMGDIDYIEQDEQLGTGHAVLIAKDEILKSKDNVLITYGDSPLIKAETLRKMEEKFLKDSLDCILLSCEVNVPFGYGRIILDEKKQIIDIIEEKEASNEIKKIKEINVGVYIFRYDSLADALDKIDNKNEKGEYYLTDAIKILVNGGGKVESYKIFDETEILGVNSKAQLATAGRILKNRKNEELMDDGVILIDPETSYIEDNAEIGRDTVIYPNTVIQGKTKIGNNCIIYSNTRIIDSNIGNNTTIEASLIEETVVEDYATVGPFAHLRPKTVLKERAHVGNFVEVKNSVLEKGVKAGHLTYIGDAEIGQNTNIGAGTITCNYDGQKKHKVKIGEDSFIGSDSIIVAPVNIGKNAVTAAGSVITEDVNDNQIAFGRARQINKERGKD
ncbi:MAG: bifunctional UDP-N-acetylglucosamine diphosphorylase/glucosamine-1-phosphate N-acetyltransferase GlmU [Fusobacteriales bacterium]|jgi:bifunctional UDP-N-acetylglucosamine pyrophosphorylase/glucosamine-1-phosphate N-acetyltransferase|nr:bifunctional UDP-N-acetylglucosamine diphosphorylase/glucosamine-1-phosphate N-acetyltransferase GlmU [Fusobacteriales bacterium]